ncbi:15349_t:CDS:2, partial [Funneliformis geosporum]
NSDKIDMQVSSLKEHAKKKELVIKDSTNNETYTEIVTISQPYTPALLKICDEIIVNTLAEGDSAITLLQTGLIQTKQLLLAGGLVLTDAELSAYKELSKEVSQLKTGFSEIILVQSEKFRNNKHLLTLTDAYELYFDKKYTTSVEFASLNYEKLLLCVN